MATHEPTMATPTSPTTGHTLKSVTAVARFEFEPGRGNEGTKVLMVEWQDEDKTRSKAGTWHVSWPGKKTVFPVADLSSEGVHRIYFLLSSGVIIPPNILIAYQYPGIEGQTDEPTSLHMSVNPLPAIFTPELGANSKTAGTKGVLHTIWAKKRLQALEKEIRNEQDHNLEGIALEIAQTEKSWIENSFGLQQRLNLPAQIEGDAASSNASSYGTSPVTSGLYSSKSPSGQRLSEKLRGLGLNTSEKDLSPVKVNALARESNSLSPEESEIADSPISAFHGLPDDNMIASPIIPPPPVSSPIAPMANLPSSTAPLFRKIVAQLPPDHVRQKQFKAPTASLDFLSQPKPEAIPSMNSLPPLQPLAQTLQKQQQRQSQLMSHDPTVKPNLMSDSISQRSTHPLTPPADSPQDDDDDDDDLFAVALSPTSPEMSKSPFSFSSEHIGAYNKMKSKG